MINDDNPKCQTCWGQAHTPTCSERLAKLPPEVVERIVQDRRASVRLWTAFAVVSLVVAVLLGVLQLTTYAAAAQIGALAGGAVAFGILARRSRKTR